VGCALSAPELRVIAWEVAGSLGADLLNRKPQASSKGLQGCSRNRSYSVPQIEVWELIMGRRSFSILKG
jgi:hypothetical protein